MCIHIYIYVYIHNGIVLSHKKNEILPYATGQMTVEGTMLSEKSQKEKDKPEMEGQSMAGRRADRGHCHRGVIPLFPTRKHSPGGGLNTRTRALILRGSFAS